MPRVSGCTCAGCGTAYALRIFTCPRCRGTEFSAGLPPRKRTARTASPRTPRGARAKVGT